MAIRDKRALVLIAAVFALLAIPCVEAQQPSVPQKVVHLMGLAAVKDNAKGTLSVENGCLHFAGGKASTDIGATSIRDVLTGTDSRKSVGKTVSLVSMAAPYGGGRFLSLFRSKIDILTILYLDGDESLHGVIFTMPAGTAETIKQQLVAQGARTTSTGATTISSTPARSSPNTEHKP
jgi:hypothetical protein